MTFLELAAAIDKAKENAKALETNLVNMQTVRDEIQKRQQAEMEAADANVNDAASNYQAALAAINLIVADMSKEMKALGLTAPNEADVDQSGRDMKKLILDSKRMTLRG